MKSLPCFTVRPSAMDKEILDGIASKLRTSKKTQLHFSVSAAGLDAAEEVPVRDVVIQEREVLRNRLRPYFPTGTLTIVVKDGYCYDQERNADVTVDVRWTPPARPRQLK